MQSLIGGAGGDAASGRANSTWVARIAGRRSSETMVEQVKKLYLGKLRVQLTRNQMEKMEQADF